MVASRRIGVTAFGKQTAKGTPLAAPTYALGRSGGVIKPEFDIADLPLTGDSAARRGRYKQRGRGAGTVTLIAHPDALGLLLYEVCGAQAASGVGPTLHTFTLADTIPEANPLTIWDMVGNDWWRFSDFYVGRIAIRGTSGENIIVEVSGVSLNAEAVAAPTFSLLDTEPRYKYIGSTVKLEADNATPVTVENVENVELVIDRSLELRYGAKLTPAFVIPDRNVDFSAGVVMDSSGNNQGWDYLHQAALGTTGLGAISQALASGGSFEVTFGRHPVDATRYLKIASNGANWEYDVDRPEPDPGGGPIEFDVAGIARRPAAGGTEVTITLANDVAGTY